MSTFRIGHRGRQLAAAVAAALAVAAVVLIVVATMAQKHASSPSPSAARPANERSLAAATPAPSTAPSPTKGAPTPLKTSGTPGRQAPTSVGPVLSRSVPLVLDVPSIGIRGARLVQLGLVKDGSIQVPPVGAGSPAGWFRGSPAPGQLGPSVILGHVDSAAAGPAIFYRLGALRPGETATVTRADGTVAVFRINSVEKYAKNNFPTLQVFGNTDHAALRLITCGGTFDPSKHSYEENIVVYANLVSSHHA